MKTGLRYLIAARRCESHDLQQLTRTCELVRATARLVHELQRERGLSTLYLGSQGTQFALERQAQLMRSEQAEAALREHFEHLDETHVPAGHGARLFSRIACALQGLDALAHLRGQTETLAWPLEQVVSGYVRLVAELLAVVYEAADTATEPTISRQLVALLNFMQGKEYAGQERATGAQMYLAGLVRHADQQQLVHLIVAQDRSHETFTAFATPSAQERWLNLQPVATLAQLERLRRLLCTAADGSPLRSTDCGAWFDCCSERMDEMQAMEDLLVDELVTACTQQMAMATQELTELESLRAKLHSGQSADTASAGGEQAFFDRAASPATPTHEHPLASPLERSVYDLVQSQADRLQRVQEELDTVRSSLNERKVIERAKGLLMAHRHLSEADAHKTLRQMAMNQNRRLVEVAEATLAMADLLPGTPPT